MAASPEKNGNSIHNDAWWESLFNPPDESAGAAGSRDGVKGNPAKKKEGKTTDKNNDQQDKTVIGDRMNVLQRWAFEQALSQIDYPADKLEDLLKTHRENSEKGWQLREEAFVNYKRIIDEEIAALEAKIKEKETIENDTTEELKALKSLKEKVTEELNGIRDRLHSLRAELARAKEELPNKWMEEAESKIKGAIRIQQTVYRETNPLYKEQYLDNKHGLDQRIEQMKRDRANYIERYDTVHTRLKSLGGDGVTHFSAQALITFGFMLAGVAGYFFSIFTFTESFGNQDLLYFLLSNFITASGHNGGAVDFLLKVSYVLMGFLLVTLVSMLCYRFINSLKKNDAAGNETESRHLLNMHFEQEGVSYSNDIKAGNWLILWLQLLPGLMITALLILLLSLNKNAITDINALNSSNEGLLFGSMIALGAGAILYLYIAKVVEVRITRAENEKGSNWLKNNRELAISFLFFILVTISIIFHAILPAKTFSTASTVTISILEFIASCFLSAFPLAYGLRLRGLLMTGQYLEKQISWLDQRIILASIPASSAIYIDYAEKVQAITDDVLMMIRNKLYLFGNPHIKGRREEKEVEKEPGKKNFVDKLQDLLIGVQDRWARRRQRQDEAMQSLSELSEWEKRYFPDHEERIRIINSEYKSKQEELQDIDVKIQQLDTKMTNEKQSREAAVDKLRLEIKTLRTSEARTADAKGQKDRKIREAHLKEEYEIISGFNLGLWCRENQLGPSDPYYLSSSSLKTSGHVN